MTLKYTTNTARRAARTIKLRINGETIKTYWEQNSEAFIKSCTACSHIPQPTSQPQKNLRSMISIIPSEARRKPRNGITFGPKEPTSPKVHAWAKSRATTSRMMENRCLSLSREFLSIFLVESNFPILRFSAWKSIACAASKNKNQSKRKPNTSKRAYPTPQESTTCNLVSCVPKEVKKKTSKGLPKEAPPKEDDENDNNNPDGLVGGSSRGPERVPSFGSDEEVCKWSWYAGGF